VEHLYGLPQRLQFRFKTGSLAAFPPGEIDALSGNLPAPFARVAADIQQQTVYALQSEPRTRPNGTIGEREFTAIKADGSECAFECDVLRSGVQQQYGDLRAIQRAGACQVFVIPESLKEIRTHTGNLRKVERV